LPAVAGVLDRVDASCFQPAACCFKSLSDDRFAMPAIVPNLSFVMLTLLRSLDFPVSSPRLAAASR
jgi:hypothetical protein